MPRPKPVSSPQRNSHLSALRPDDRACGAGAAPETPLEKVLIGAVTFALMLLMMFVVVMVTLAIAAWGVW